MSTDVAVRAEIALDQQSVRAGVAQDQQPVILVEARHASAATFVKRAFDVVFSLILLLLLAPVLTLIGLMVRLTSAGPALVRQERMGLCGRPFILYKFRSMIADAEAVTGPVFATPDDTRRTAVGVVLRRLSLDELPQLFNILRGDMSLVGPRPERPVFISKFRGEIPRYIERLQVRPGVTGWAQVNGLRGNTSMEQRTTFDLHYIDNWSLLFDVKILLVTAATVFFHRHAY